MAAPEGSRRAKRKGPKPLSQLPVVPVMPAVPAPAAPAMVPATPASPAAMPTPAAVIMRMEVAITVSRPVPAVAPSVADVVRLFNVRSLRGLTWNGGRHCRRSSGRQSNSAKKGNANKCRNKFHDISPPNACWSDETTCGFGHCSSLMSMNNRWLFGNYRSARFPICNQPASNGAPVAAHQSPCRWRVR
jgi:hypothetical protein